MTNELRPGFFGHRIYPERTNENFHLRVRFRFCPGTRTAYALTMGAEVDLGLFTAAKNSRHKRNIKNEKKERLLYLYRVRTTFCLRTKCYLVLVKKTK